MAKPKNPGAPGAAFEVALYLAEAAVGRLAKNVDYARGFFVGRGYSIVDSYEMAARAIKAVPR